LLRCSVSAAHTDADIDRIVERFGEVVAQQEELAQAQAV
jgi:cysteine sulfinate desulfinase/cysteine desulfurase-like protein